MISTITSSLESHQPTIENFDDSDDLDGSWSDAHANFLSSLSEEETDDLLKFARKKKLEAKNFLFQAGDRSNDVYVVAEGCVRLFQISATGKETILWFSFPGEIFGIAELFSGGDRQIYANATENSVVYAVKRSNFARFINKHPEVAMRAIGILSARVRTLGHVLVGLTTDNVEARIARLLFRFAHVSSVLPCTKIRNGELCVNVRLTHQDIANLIGASRQTVTTTLSELKKSGALQSIDRHVHITEPKRLKRILNLRDY